MTKFLALNISTSQDGFMAGAHQTLDNPMGENGQLLHQWAFKTKAFHDWLGMDGGDLGVNNHFITRGFTNIGASIMGRNMFGPVRGEWTDNQWRGWWGDEPKFQHPVFILTHYAREAIDMGNGTVFHFITDGIEQARDLALTAANGKDVRVGGGASTLHQFLEAGYLDELHVAEIPVDLKSGERLITDSEKQLAKYELARTIPAELVTHKIYLKK